MTVDHMSRVIPRGRRAAPLYIGHLVEFNNEENAAEFTAFISIMEGYSVLHLLRHGCTVAFEASTRSAFLDHWAEWADWSTVVRYFNTSGFSVILDGKPVGIAGGDAA